MRGSCRSGAYSTGPCSPELKRNIRYNWNRYCTFRKN